MLIAEKTLLALDEITRKLFQELTEYFTCLPSLSQEERDVRKFRILELRGIAKVHLDLTLNVLIDNEHIALQNEEVSSALVRIGTLAKEVVS